MNLGWPSFSNEWKKSYRCFPQEVRLLQKITFRPCELFLMDEWRIMALMICICKIGITGDPWYSKFIEMRFGDRTDCNTEGQCRSHRMWTQCVSQNLLFWCEVRISGGGHHIRIHDCRRQVTVILKKYFKCGHKWRIESLCVCMKHIEIKACIILN
jgi:hypothetical protein